ncbi:hypothetical protein SGRIM128S_06101 [Streptomyces griseomycini]
MPVPVASVTFVTFVPSVAVDAVGVTDVASPTPIGRGEPITRS